MQQMNKKPDDLKEGLAREGKGLVMVKQECIYVLE